MHILMFGIIKISKVMLKQAALSGSENLNGFDSLESCDINKGH